MPDVAENDGDQPGGVENGGDTGVAFSGADGGGPATAGGTDCPGAPLSRSRTAMSAASVSTTIAGPTT
jgi:hypothetical protein